MNKDEQITHVEAILKALDDAIMSVPVEKGTFYKAIADRLLNVRNQYLLDLGISFENDVKVEDNLAKEKTAKEFIEVYVLLYLAEGVDIQKWEKLLNTVLDRAITRPIYQNEQFAITALRNAADKLKQAYIAITIPKNSIIQLPAQNRPKDRHGHELLVIDSIGLEKGRISRFIHKSGFYHFKNQKLVWEKAIHFL